MSTILLIDLSAICHPLWHTNTDSAQLNAVSTKAVERVRSMAQDKPHTAVCCDCGKSFRHDVSEAYKANRPPSEAGLKHQIALAQQRLEADGFPVWSLAGFEADDLIAAATVRALEIDGVDVLIASADKDLLQLVGPRVRQMSTRDGAIFDTAAVQAKFGVLPGQMRDWLTIVGDKADNIQGIPGLGEKTASDLLSRFESLDAIYRDMTEVGPLAMGLTPKVATALKNFHINLPTTRALVTLRSDAPIPFDDILRERVSRAVATFDPESDAMDTKDQEQPAAEVTEAQPVKASAPVTALAVQEPEVLAPVPAEWERQLDPRSMRDARLLAKDMHDSLMFSAYGSPQGVLSTVMVGRELGLPAMASLRSIHNIDGRHALAASLMVALVLKSGLAEYFEPISFSETEATYETKRKGARNPVRLTHTFEMGKKAWPKSKADWEVRFNDSGWGKNPTDMVVARAQSRLARMVYPDLLAGLYTPEELSEIREQAAA